MPKVNLTNGMRDEYQRLFDCCQVRSNKTAMIERTVEVLVREQVRYEAAAAPLGVPWFFVAVIHNLEASLRFDRHLHNGDSLTARTVHVPAGRPVAGDPPFTWEESATDALRFRRLDAWHDWSVPGTLYQLEGYNGWGYRLYHSHVLSPYLWGFSNHYTSGKYVADGRWSDTAVSRQCGAAVLLRRMVELGRIQIGEEFAPSPTVVVPRADLPALRYSTKRIAYADKLQEFLNQFPDIYLKVDGKPGQKTSDAFKAVSGQYLTGDPRARD